MRLILLIESGAYRLANQVDPLESGSKWWLTSNGTWYQLNVEYTEHANVSSYMERDGIHMGGAIRVIEDNGRVLFDGSPNKTQMRGLLRMLQECTG